MTNLRFADDIFVCTETPQELQQMLQELSDESRRMGLKMNIAKTKMMHQDTMKNHGRLGGIRQTPGYLQHQPCHLPEETGVHGTPVYCQLAT